MFIMTDSGRLQNLCLLQGVITTEEILEDESTIYRIGYIQLNGEIINEGEYSTKEEADSKVEEIKTKLLS